MLKKILVAIGIAKAPAPVKSYLTVSSFFGAVPAIAWVAWKNREAIRSTVARLRQGRGAASQQLRAPSAA